MSWKDKLLDSFIIIKDMIFDFLKTGHSYLVGFVVAVVLGFLLQLTGWWVLMLLAGGFAGFLLKKSGFHSFLIGFIGIAVVWGGFFIYFLTIGPLFEFLALISSVIGIFETNPAMLLVITIVIGGLLGGLGAMNGTYIAFLIYPHDSTPEKPKLETIKLPKK